MIIGRFLLWARHAPADQRAEAVAALARAFTDGDLAPADAEEAEVALTAMLDDPAPAVRIALAEAFATSERAPKHVLLGLLADTSDITTILVAHSPLLDDADLVECVTGGDASVQVAAASRRPVSVGLSAALAEIGSVAALIALARNEYSLIGCATLIRIVEQHGGNPALREALLSRPDLPIEVAQLLAVAIAKDLFRAKDLFGTGDAGGAPGASSRQERDARDRATVSLAVQAGPRDVVRLVRHLRRSGQMTATLLLRALLSGALSFFQAAFVELSGRPAPQVAAILTHRRAPAFQALYARTGLPPALRPAFEAGLSAFAHGPVENSSGRARVSRRFVTDALAACRALPGGEGRSLVALLRRFDVEAARDAAREGVEAIADGTALRFILEKAPEMLAIEDLSAQAA